ncbi:MAG: HD domain-containing protein [Candidatus Thiodiazotropha sp. (ex Epidulcina cf. delphinae)]|nr:HD domain-containing protein [Candidatus Thiodiazotropha sp. (ex Epidulcina cf. delphinae)]
MTKADPYVKQVTSLGDNHEVVAREDIRNTEGISLVKRGARIDGSLYERLVRHKLLQPLDESLSVADMVSPLGLVVDAKRLLASEPALVRVVDTRSMQRDLLSPLGEIRLEHPLAFKLTVCRERSVERYHHLIRVALIALYAASRLHWSRDDVQVLATAAIFHDLGEMHLDPSLFDRSRLLTFRERRQIYTHPTIAFLILKAFPAYHPHISHVVHQHHERWDGSGYPAGLAGDDLLPAARLLGAAELLTVIGLERKKAGNGLFSTADVMKLNTDRFGSEFILPLIEAAKRIDGEVAVSSSNGAVNKTTLEIRLNLLVEILQEAKDVDMAAQGGIADFISSQLEHLAEMAGRCGIDLNAPAELLTLIGDDEQALSEWDVLVREMFFLLQSTVREALRRWEKVEMPEADREPLDAWLRHTEMALQGADIQS